MTTPKDKVENSRTEGGLLCYLCLGERKKNKREKSAVVKKQTEIQEIKMQNTNSNNSNTNISTQKSEPTLQTVANSGSLSFNSSITSNTGMGMADEEITRSALSNFRAKEEEIERKKMEVRERVQAQLGRVEEETKRLAMIREVYPLSLYFVSFCLFIYFFCFF